LRQRVTGFSVKTEEAEIPNKLSGLDSKSAHQACQRTIIGALPEGLYQSTLAWEAEKDTDIAHLNQSLE
jgi:hypothetical protein